MKAARGRERITMLLENNPYPLDVRVRKEAESLVAAGYAVEVVAPRASGQPSRERVRGVEVRRFRAVDGTDRGLVAKLLEYLVAGVALNAAAVGALARGSTVLHIHNPPDILFPAGALFRLAGRRVVFDQHDLAPELVATKFRRRALVKLARITERLTFAVASHVLAANESHAAVASERGRKAPHEVTIVRNGPPASWTEVPLQLREGLLSPVRLAYLGELAEQDGVEWLADVLAALRDREPPVPAVLTIIGDGDARPEIEAAFRRLNVEDRVTFTGWVPLERVPELLAQADVCLDPAPASELNHHSTMVKLTEYMALGKPIVASDLLESGRTVGDAAVLVPPGNAEAFADRIAGLAEDPDLRATLASRARGRARELTWEKSEAALLAAYESLSRAQAA